MNAILKDNYNNTPVTANQSLWYSPLSTTIVFSTHDLVTHIYLCIKSMYKLQNKKYSSCNRLSIQNNPINWHKVELKYQSEYEKSNFEYLSVIKSQTLI